MRTWPTLYKKNSDGVSFQQWTIAVHEPGEFNGAAFPVITKTYGQVGGKMQTAVDAVQTGKNIGKSNETTPHQQALLEAEAQWVKKQSGAKGYTPSMDDAQAGIKSDLHAGGTAPMLAKKYGVIINNEFEPIDNKKIVFPCYVQQKLNGQRCLAHIVDGKVELYSRECKPITTIPHIVEALETIFAGETVIFDGELYNHDFYEHLEDIRHMVAHGDERIEYHIYDVADKDRTYEQRFELMKELFNSRLDQMAASGKIRPLTTYIAKNHEQVVTAFNWARDKQYEGAIIRNAAGKYAIAKRSFDLQKLKGFIDKEFTIVDIIEAGKGTAEGKAKFVCTTGADDPIPDVTFEVLLAASQERRAEIFQNREDYIGKPLTVRFVYYTIDGKPFHATGQAIRDYE